MTNLKLQFTPKIPVNFLSVSCPLSWQEISWARKHEILKDNEVVEFARLKINKSQLETELSELNTGSFWKVSELLSKLVDIEMQTSESSIVEKWQFIILKYIYTHATEFTDILQSAEQVYADFGYPKNMQGFIRYMPVTDDMYNPSEHSSEENRNRLLAIWKNYLDFEEQRFSGSRNE